MVIRNNVKSVSRPLKGILAKTYAAMDEDRTTMAVVALATNKLLKMALPKGNRENNRSYASKLTGLGIHCTGRTNNAPRALRDVDTIQKNGIRLKNAIMLAKR
jgi:hypothetical protein